MEAESSGEYCRLTPEDFTPRSKKGYGNGHGGGGGHAAGYVGTEHILLAVLRDETSVAVRLLASLGARPDELFDDVARAVEPVLPRRRRRVRAPARPEQGGRRRQNAHAGSIRPGSDPDGPEGQAGPGHRPVGEIERVIQILSRRTKNNPCRSASPAGKTAIAEGLAQKSPPTRYRSCSGASGW